MTIRRKLLSFGSRSTDVRLGFGALDELPKFLSGAVGKPSRAYVLSSDDIDHAHVETVRRALVDGGFNAAVRCIAASDALGAETALAQYAELSAAGITAEDLIVGVGGDEACSLASFISRTWCGGVSCALVPTTLDAMIRCSTQMTPLTVSGGSLVSLEPEVSLVVCDLALVGDRPIEENGLGYALMCGAY
ncbi:MAG: hypothetical protein ACLUW6_12190, partial [Coriobacteriaceae bacterium]